MDRRQFLLGGLAACAVPRVAPTPVAAPAPTPRPPLVARLAALAVADDDFYRDDLYSWTTASGIANLRASKHLLVATATTGGFLSPFLQMLTATAARPTAQGRIAKLLLAHPALIRRRYAWTAPFATVMGMGKRTYGTSLIRIQLRPDAWIGRFAIGDEMRFVDARGATVPHADVASTPERIGAMFHVFAEQPAFREYVVISEAMVGRWSIATPEIRAVIDDEIDLLHEVREAGFTAAGAERSATASWRRTPVGIEELWHASLAFDNERYRARPAQLDAIIAALAAYDPAGPPLVHAAAYSARSSSHSSSSAT